MSSQNAKDPKSDPATAPDPDEDDLDDLDEMLDEFQNTKVSDPPSKPANTTAAATSSAPTTSPSASGPGRPATSSGEKETDETNPADLDEDEFAKQLQAGMAEMLKDLETNPEMAKHFENMMAQFGGAPPSSSAGASPSTTKDAKATPGVSMGHNVNTEETFQDTIKKTMDRMKQSSASASAASKSDDAMGDDFMANLLKEMQNAGEGGDGEDAFSKMLLGMMEQLTNKEILYEPMKELDTKFDPWLQERTTGDKKGELSKEDESRYREQRQLVREIVARFERPQYDDGNAEDREYVVERMQKMQAAGAPPPDLVGDVSGAENMLNGLGDPEGGCPTQ